MIISQIAACSENRVIGLDNKLPWHIPEDLKYFREKTKGKICIMGRKTFDSLPGVLPGRPHIVITRDTQAMIKHSTHLIQQAAEKKVPIFIVNSLEEAIFQADELIKTNSLPEEVMVCGGAEIYRQAMAISHVIYLTRIHQKIEGDAFYPEISESEYQISEQDHRQGPVHFTFEKYERIPIQKK